MKHLLCSVIVFGFVLFNADLGNNLHFVMRMNEKNGQTSILWNDDGKLRWMPIEEIERHVQEYIPPEQVPPRTPDWAKPKW